MTVRDELNACRTALIEIAAIERQLARLENLTAPEYVSNAAIRREKIPGKEEYIASGRTNHPEAAREQAIDGCIERLNSRKAQLAEMMRRLEDLLELLEDGRVRTILRYYYSCGWSDEHIAEELDMARQTVTSKRNEAVKYLEAATDYCCM